MNFYTSSVGVRQYDHSLLVLNDLTNIHITCEDVHCSAKLLCYVYDIYKSRYPSMDEHSFLRLLKGPDDAEILSTFLRTIIWILSHDRDFPDEFRIPATALASVYIKYYSELKPRAPTTNCWTCRMSKNNLPFQVPSIKGFPAEAELYIVPISDHDGKTIEFSGMKTLYKSPSKKKHNYVISSDMPPLSARYTVWDGK
uniref:Nonstructural protein 3 n=1 Tax=Maize stripe virus TaxID=3052767 RepID=A0A8G0QBB4_MSTV|nr:nonstructural protein 3 [Tenuivirus zeae]